MSFGQVFFRWIFSNQVDLHQRQLLLCFPTSSAEKGENSASQFNYRTAPPTSFQGRLGSTNPLLGNPSPFFSYCFCIGNFIFFTFIIELPQWGGKVTLFHLNPPLCGHSSPLLGVGKALDIGQVLPCVSLLVLTEKLIFSPSPSGD